ncbi:MAG: 5-(carboxyamino)imidazole ribonucleotide synthase [Alphaproteobacteria bacterium]|nr:5-(carboxyamino)imidazole ribonucleotide synthase [Alphaproteobacteria bacterium]
MKDLGILGGGQLGRMTAMAAAQMGLSTLIFDPNPNCCAGQVSALQLGAFDDTAALSAFAEQVAAITLEFENIPSDSVRHLANLKPMHPSATLLEICQDRLSEKTWLTTQGLKVAPYHAINQLEDIQSALAQAITPCLLKTRRFGYDGKGQVQFAPDANPAECQAAWEAMGRVPCILESFVPFECEVSLIVARNAHGAFTHLPLVENHHESLPEGGKILRTTRAPAEVSPATLQQAADIGRQVAEASNLVGVLALEMFLLANGALMINEMAPRPHNSGHWSIEGASVSQFALLVRAACSLPLPETITATQCEMHNLLNDEADDLGTLLRTQENHVHIYGKGVAKPGRKMGHVTRKT